MYNRKEWVEEGSNKTIWVIKKTKNNKELILFICPVLAELILFLFDVKFIN